MRLTAGRQGRGAAAAVLAGAALAYLAGAFTPWSAQLFDAYQRWAPRPLTDLPVVVVAIDERSLEHFGQWPWPRTLTASLLSRLQALKPLAIGLDIVMSEPDRLSPENLLEHHPGAGRRIREALSALPSNDRVLADSLEAGVPVVLGRVGVRDPASARATRERLASYRIRGPAVLGAIPAYEAALRNVDVIEVSGAGHGLLNGEPDADGTVRKMPLLGRVGDAVFPALGLEMLRVAQGAEWFELETSSAGVDALRVGALAVPTDPGGRVRLRFSPSNPRRYLSASTVLGEWVEPERVNGKLVIVGVTGLGLTDAPPTPVAARMHGVEIQAQLLENLLEGTGLRSLPHARVVEVATGAVLAGILVALLPGLGWWLGAVIWLLLTGAALAASLAAFDRGLLLDPTFPLVALGACFAVLSYVRAARAERARRALVAELETARIRSAKLAGELGAARDIQRGILPAPAGFDLPAGCSLHAYLEPASEVGGDLYDIVPLGAGRLLLVLGDVSGKGVPASLFMAVSKTLCKSIALRGTAADTGSILTDANREISRENPTGLFVTMAAAVLDVRSGELGLSLAGHEPPWVAAAGALPRRLSLEAGPPLCVVPGYRYPSHRLRLDGGEALVLVTDGVTEALDHEGRLYGSRRVEEALAGLDAAEDAAGIVERIRTDVHAFMNGADPSDDIAVLAFRFEAGADASAPPPRPSDGRG